MKPIRTPVRKTLATFASVAVVCTLSVHVSAPAALRDAAAQDQAPPRRPRLVVVISIDQFRADYLTRFEDLWKVPAAEGTGAGFRWFQDSQAVFDDVHHEHFPTYTGPGHAVLLTGAPPATNGIIGNAWYDRATKKRKYCVEGTPDPKAPERMRMSPETLLVTTVGDELEKATGGRSKTFSFGLKDRASILMAGHLADGVFWFDDEQGRWQTSAYYRGDDQSPEWLRKWNQERVPDRSFGKAWEFSCPESALARLWVAPGEAAPKAFRYVLDLGRPAPNAKSPREAEQYYKASFAPTPFANEWVLETALRCVEGAGMGQDDVPDLLTINLSSSDYVGHRFGPDSAEVMDISVRTDRALAAFFDGLRSRVPGGLESCVVAVTADHGVAPNPQSAAKSGLPAGVQADDDASIGVSPQRAAAEAALDRAFGEAEWTEKHEEQFLYLNEAAIAARKDVRREDVELVAAAACAKFPGIYACFTRTQIFEGRLPATRIGRAVALGFHPKVSGDVAIVPDSLWLPARGAGTTHGSPWTYDSKVPLLLGGFGIRRGHFREKRSTLDIAPTLACLLGVAQPSGCEGRILAEAVR